MNKENVILKVLSNKRLFNALFKDAGYKVVLLFRCWSEKINIQIENSNFYWINRLQDCMKEPKDIDANKVRSASQDETYEDVELIIDGARKRSVVFNFVKELIGKRNNLFKNKGDCTPFSVYYLSCSLYRFFKTTEMPIYSRSDRCPVHNLEDIAFYAFDEQDSPEEKKMTMCLIRQESHVVLFKLHLYTEYEVYKNSDKTDKCYFDKEREQIIVFDFDASNRPDSHIIYEHGDEQDFKDSIKYFVMLSNTEILDLENLRRFDYNIVREINKEKEPKRELPSLRYDMTNEKKIDNFLVVDRNNCSQNVKKLFWTVPTNVNSDEFIGVLRDMMDYLFIDMRLCDVNRTQVVEFCVSQNWVKDGKLVADVIHGSDWTGQFIDNVLDSNLDWEDEVKKNIIEKSARYPEKMNECLVVDEFSITEESRNIVSVFGFSNNTGIFTRIGNNDFSDCILETERLTPASSMYLKIGEYTQVEMFVEKLERDLKKPLDFIQDKVKELGNDDTFINFICSECENLERFYRKTIQDMKNAFQEHKDQVIDFSNFGEEKKT